MPDNSTGRAVVIEDDDDIRLLISTVLQQRGLDVRAAASGLAGLALVQEHQPDLVTLDLGLPDIEGTRGVPPAAHDQRRLRGDGVGER